MQKASKYERLPGIEWKVIDIRQCYRYIAVLFYNRLSFFRTSFIWPEKYIGLDPTQSILASLSFEGVRNAELGFPAGGQNTKCLVPSLRHKFSI
jgi:hypothetical protein